MSPPVFLRTAGKADVAAVSRLLGETWHATYDAIYGETRVEEITRSWHAPRALEARLGRPNTEFVVADDGSRILGMAFAGAGGADGKMVSLHQLYVHPDAQGRGIGRDLLGEIEGCFPSATRMRLEVEEANYQAVAFYERHGFAKVGSTEGKDGDFGIPAAVYEKALA